MRTLLPSYMRVFWNCYEQMAREDRAVVDPLLVSVNPLDCHVAVLPFLAWEAGVNIEGFSERVQRDLVAGAFRTLPYRGTRYALESALDAFLDVDVVEWYEDARAPFTFKLDFSVVKDVEITPKMVRRVEEIAEQNKNARSTINELLLSYRVRGAEVSESVGCMGESSCYASMVDGFEETMHGARVVVHSGCMGEAYAVAIFAKEV